MYLIQIVDEKTGPKLRAVVGQKFPDGRIVEHEINVQGDTAVRKKLGTGEYIVAKDLTDRGKFYQMDPVFWVVKESHAKEFGYEMADSAGMRLVEDLIGGVSAVGRKITPKPKATEVADDSFLGRLMKSKKFQPPAFDKTGFHIDEGVWWLLVRNIKKLKSTMLYGHSGTGKTELVMTIAEQIGMPIQIFDMGSALDPTATLVGVHRLHDGKSVFDFSRFYHAIQVPGIVLLDELSRAPENTTNLLLPCLDSRRTLYTDVGRSEVPREVAVHPQCIFIATANIGSEYVGVNLLDKALLSRFFKVELDYPESDIETMIIVHRTEIDPDDANAIVKICQDIRHSYADGTFSKDVSLRESLEVGNCIADGYTLIDALKMVLLPAFEGGIEGGERAQVMAKIMGA